ncbi:oligosaccharide flippase family protein [Vibrio coralliirubri]|uniref:oligosaccharide flippase family protein n=1 Tax=Vibrio coralliirubri TaxID=1516159 RepID=UPI00065DE60D|nr:oligosaccharide flippase family protein [Vibrio coralliirubri]
MDKKNIIKSLLSNGAIRACSMLIGISLNILIVRSLGADESGKYYYIVGFVTALANICSLGLNNWLIRELTKDCEEKDKINHFINVIIRVFISSAFLMLIIYFFIDPVLSLINKSDLKNQLIILLPVIVLLAIYPYFVAVYQSGNKVNTASFLQAAAIPLITIVSLYILKPDNSEDLSLIFLISVSSICSILFIKQLYVNRKKINFSFNKIEEFKSFFSLHLIYNITTLYMLLVNGYFLSNTDFAIYNGASRLAVLAGFLLIVFNFVSAPKYSTYYNNQDLDRLESYSQYLTRIMMMVLTPILILVIFLSNNIMSIYGSEFDGYGYVLIVLFFGQFVTSVLGSSGYLLTLTGNEKFLTKWNLCLMPLYFLMAWGFIYFWGLIGAALSTMIASLISNIVSYLLVKYRLGFNLITFRKIG